MGYLDLLRGIKPGERIAREAAGASRALDNVASRLPQLEQAGKNLPNFPFLRDPASRQAARTTFHAAAVETRDAAATARQFTRNSRTTSFTQVVLDAQEARITTARAAGFGLPEYIAAPARDAAGRTRRAAGALEIASGRPLPAQTGIARTAAVDLEFASNAASTANHRLQTTLLEFQPYDRLRLAAEANAGRATINAQKAARVDKVGSATAAAADEAAQRTRDASVAINSLRPGEQTATAAGVVSNARIALNRAEVAGRAEPAYATFSRDVTVARAGTGIAVAGVSIGALLLANKA